jgi:hypothetical protein
MLPLVLIQKISKRRSLVHKTRDYHTPAERGFKYIWPGGISQQNSI